MSILVTGGAGFIGKRLVRALLAQGVPVCVLDDYSAAPEHAIDRHLPKLRVYKGSVTDERLVDAVLQKNCIQHIFHLATRNITRSQMDPVNGFAVNAGGTAVILERAKAHGVRHVIYTSTSSVYGDRVPATEEDTPAPRTIYSVAKLAGERCCQLSSMPTTVLRLSNVYGPGQDNVGNPYCGVIGHFMLAASLNRPVVLYGDGTATRDYTYVDDVVEALLTVLHRSKFGTFNVGTGEETSTLELVRLVEKVTKKTLVVERRENRTIDVIPRRVLDARKLCRETNWKPLTSLEAGLALTWDRWRS